MKFINTNNPHNHFKRTTLRSLLLMVMVLCSPMLYAQTDALNKCKAIQDSAKRLACYDALETIKETTTESNATVEQDATQASQALDEIDRRAQALMSKTKSNDQPFSSNTARISSGGPDISNRQEQSEMDDFGSAKSASDESKIVGDELFSQVTGIKRDFRDYATFTLSNGQIWRQTEVTQLRIRSGDDITIEKGVLSSYYLSKPDNNRQVRVVRVK